MMINEKNEIIERVKNTLVKAGSYFMEDKIEAYHASIDVEKNTLSKWAMDTIVENAKLADKNSSPLCDDTGIPHLILEIGESRCISGEILEAVYEGVEQGLRTLPGRPMAIKGNDQERIDQSGGLDEKSEAVVPAPLMLKYVKEENTLRLTILMQGGGPEIRAKTYRVFHRHNMQTVLDEVISWAKESAGQLGCTPCTLAIGIGRSHYEASSLMLQAMAEGNYSNQSGYEKYITEEVNKTGVGALGLGGKTTVLGTFLKIGPQRASGVRIVCMRPCCCMEPRKYSVDL